MKTTHTPLPWKLKIASHDETMFYITSEDERLPNGYPRPEIMADDAHEGNGYPIEQKMADAELIVKAVNVFNDVKDLLDTISKDFEQFPCLPSTLRRLEEMREKLK